MHVGPPPAAPRSKATEDVRYTATSLVSPTPGTTITNAFSAVIQGTANYLEFNLDVADPGRVHADPTIAPRLQIRVYPVLETIRINGTKRTFTGRAFLLADGELVGTMFFVSCLIWLDNREGDMGSMSLPTQRKESVNGFGRDRDR